MTMQTMHVVGDATGTPALSEAVHAVAPKLTWSARLLRLAGRIWSGSPRDRVVDAGLLDHHMRRDIGLGPRVDDAAIHDLHAVKLFTM